MPLLDTVMQIGQAVLTLEKGFLMVLFALMILQVFQVKLPVLHQPLLHLHLLREVSPAWKLTAWRAPYLGDVCSPSNEHGYLALDPESRPKIYIIIQKTWLVILKRGTRIFQHTQVAHNQAKEGKWNMLIITGVIYGIKKFGFFVKKNQIVFANFNCKKLEAICRVTLSVEIVKKEKFE